MVMDVTENGTTLGSRGRPRNVKLSTGLPIFGGYIVDEYLPDLRPWTRAAKIFREMADDTIVGSLFEAVNTPLLATPFIVEPVDNSDEQKYAVEFIKENIFEIPNQDWQQHVEDMLDYLQFGFALAEKIAYKKTNGKLYIRTLMPIAQETLLRWGERNRYGEVTKFIQLDPVIGEVREAPMNKLLHFVWNPRKRNPMGHAIFRSLYRPWYFKKNLEVLEAIGIERDVGNVPIAQLEEIFYSTGTPEQQAQRYEQLKETLGNFKMDENAYLISPFGVEIKAYQSSSKAYNVRESIRDWGHVIRQRFFADFLALGSMGEGGTQALAEEQNIFFKLALTSVQRKMLETWNKQLIPWLFGINNWKLEKYPQLTWKDPSAINMQAYSQALTQLIQIGAVPLTKTLQQHLAEKLKLPYTEDEKTIDMPVQRVDNGGVGGDKGDTNGNRSDQSRKKVSDNSER